MADDMISITELVNQALDKSYLKTAGPVLKQVNAICNAPGSPLQAALKELESEATRLEQLGAPLLPDNAVLLKTLATVEKIYETTALLIQAQASNIQAGGASLAIPAVTAKVFTGLSSSQIDPLSPQALNFYLSTLKQKGITWRTG